jgi:hypothetical protein
MRCRTCARVQLQALGHGVALQPRRSSPGRCQSDRHLAAEIARVMNDRGPRVARAARKDGRTSWIKLARGKVKTPPRSFIASSRPLRRAERSRSTKAVPTRSTPRSCGTPIPSTRSHRFSPSHQYAARRALNSQTCASKGAGLIGRKKRPACAGRRWPRVSPRLPLNWYARNRRIRSEVLRFAPASHKSRLSPLPLSGISAWDLPEHLIT